MGITLRQQAIELVKAGKTRKATAIYLSVPLRMVYEWTNGMQRNNRKQADIEPGPATEPIGDVSMQERLEAMRRRFERGEELYHPCDCPLDLSRQMAN